MKMRAITVTVALTSIGLLLVGCGGDDGIQGEQGDPGEDGTNGKNGAKGDPGEDGTNGKDGAKGDPGEDGTNGKDGAKGDPGEDGMDGMDGMDLTAAPKLIRLATTPLGAEVTGMFATDAGSFFFNIQHPLSSLPGDEGLAAVGVWTGVNIDNLDPHMESLEVPDGTSADAETTLVAKGSYQVLGREGDTFDDALPLGFGAIVNAAGDAAVKQSNNPDFNGFIPTTNSGNKGYLFTAWEDRPGAMSRLEVGKESDGSWTVLDAMNVDFSSVSGTMINCFGTVSPWGTPLTSEENYEAENTVRWNDSSYAEGYPNYADVQNIQTYLGGTYPNPYDYGYIVEITAPKSASPTPVKHFTLGRMAHENPVIMPDHKTVYLTDDGGSKAFYKFVADTAGNLGSGTLYAAKLSQDGTSSAARAGFNIAWIELGSASNADIESWIDEYDGIDESDFVDVESTSYITDADVDAYAAGTAADQRVAFLESRKAAEAKGATMEFNKMEGINISYAGVANGTVPFMYVAMSDVTGAMTDGTGDIHLGENRCGIVYRLGLTADFDVLRMDPVVVGGPYDDTAAVNPCSTEGIANPDNVVVLRDGRVLIGEDTGRHENNMIWIYNPQGE